MFLKMSFWSGLLQKRPWQVKQLFTVIYWCMSCYCDYVHSLCWWCGDHHENKHIFQTLVPRSSYFPSTSFLVTIGKCQVYIEWAKYALGAINSIHWCAWRYNWFLWSEFLSAIRKKYGCQRILTKLLGAANVPSINICRVITARFKQRIWLIAPQLLLCKLQMTKCVRSTRLLDPMLFNIFINHLIYVANDFCPLHNYADGNTHGYFGGKTWWRPQHSSGLVWRKSHASKYLSFSLSFSDRKAQFQI